MKNKFNQSTLVLGSLLIAGFVAGCNGSNNSNSSDSSTLSTANTSISGLAYDSVTTSVFSVNSFGRLCSISVDKVPGDINCNLTMPANIIVTSQVVSDGSGNIYALGKQIGSNVSYLMQYKTQNQTWTTTQIELPYLGAFNKILYRANKLYASNPNDGTLYTITLGSNAIESVAKYFAENPAVVEDFDASGNLYFSHQTNKIDPTTYRTVLATTAYVVPSGSAGGALANQFGTGNVTINDMAYVNNKIYACAESDFLYLPTGSTAANNWQILTNQAKLDYFSCDYLTTDSANLYYVEGIWVDENTFSNGYVNKVAV